MDITSPVGGCLQFFFYDVIKITILLCTLIFVISYIQSYFPPERSKKILGKFKGIWANTISALLGTVTPFCSCSSIPLFIGFTSAGLPISSTFSFLISSPMVDLGSLVLLMSIFGGKIAILYVIFGLVIAVVGGTFIGSLHMEDQVADFVINAKIIELDIPKLTVKDRLNFAKEQVEETFKKVFLYILIGVGIGAVIHNVIPEEWIQKLLGTNNIFGVLIATLLGIPMYADIFGTIPIAEALAKKYGEGVIEAYSAGTATKDKISQDAVRLMKEIYHIDMEESQKPKLIDDIPQVDYVVTMGCNVVCPVLPYSYGTEDWGLDDSTGRPDEEFKKIIDSIDEKVRDLVERVKSDKLN